MARTFSHVTFSPALSPPLPLALSFQMRTKWKREKMEHEPLGVGDAERAMAEVPRGTRPRGNAGTFRTGFAAAGRPRLRSSVRPRCFAQAWLSTATSTPCPPWEGRSQGYAWPLPWGSEGVQDTRSRGPFSCREGAIGAETPSRGPGLSRGVTRASAPPSPPPCWDWDMSAPRREPREGSGHPSSLSGASLVCTVGRSRGRHWVTLS